MEEERCIFAGLLSERCNMGKSDIFCNGDEPCKKRCPFWNNKQRGEENE